VVEEKKSKQSSSHEITYLKILLLKMMRNILKARKFMYVKEFKGLPTAAHFELVEEELAELNDGEFLASAEFLSVDPYQRAMMLNFKPPALMVGGQIAQ
jgi:prostaglandin reductase 1